MLVDVGCAGELCRFALQIRPLCMIVSTRLVMRTVALLLMYQQQLCRRTY